MTNIRIHVAYDGTEYHGWQRQPGVRTVEGELLHALATLLNCEEDVVQLQGASRTDAGVHARGQVANIVFDADRDVWDFVRSLNALTDPDISVNFAELVPDEFNARFDSKGKRYVYTIWNHRFPHPWLHRLHWTFSQRTLDTDAMNDAAQHLVGEHDFSAFRAADCQSSSTVREISKVDVKTEGHAVIVTVVGTAFLKNMVRILVGSLVDVGTNYRSKDWIAEVLASRDRQNAGRTAPASGLVLDEVFYDLQWEKRVDIGAW